MNITHAGMAAVIGRPNAGKSTLINKLIGEKVSIVSDKPQTTRHRICACLNEASVQVVLIDTPGFHRPRNKLGEYMTRVIRESFNQNDAVVMVVEPIACVGDLENELIKQLRKCRAILVINKIDKIEKEKILDIIAQYEKAYSFEEIIPLSALTGDGVDRLKENLIKLMPQGHALFPETMSTDQPDRLLISELIREKILNLMREEIPHGTQIVVEKLSERNDGIIDISAYVYCEKESHKGMLIGKNGGMLKRIGSQARCELEEMYEGKVNLQLWVKVKENWRDSSAHIRNFGYR